MRAVERRLQVPCGSVIGVRRRPMHTRVSRCTCYSSTSTGTWERLECSTPLTPRRSGTEGEGTRCICLPLPSPDPCHDAEGQQCKAWAAKGECEVSGGLAPSW